MLIITDIAGNTEALTGYKGLRRYRNVSGEKTLAFLIVPTTQNAHSFPMVQEESVLEFKGESYRIKQVSEKNRGQTFVKEVVAIHTLFDLIDEHIYEVRNGSMTFQAFLQFVFAGTPYTWDIVDSFLAQDWENFGDDNRLALYQEGLQRYGAEFTLTDTHFTFKQKIGNATDFQFRYGYNIKTINRNVNTNNLSTYIKGYGKQNEDGSYVVQSEYTSPNAAVFGIRHAKPVRDEHYTTVEGLNERLKVEIKDIPEVSITVDFVDMRRAGYPYDVPNEGDDLFLIYEPMNNLDLEARLMEIWEEFEEFNEYPIKTDVTLANFRNNMTDKFIEYSRTQKTVNGIMDGSRKIPYNALDDAVKRATAALQSAQTELEFENGIIARDKTNPNFLVLLNSAGLGVSTDGGATFRQAITYLGVNTDVLTAGQINANNISVQGGTETSYSLIDANGLSVKGGAIRMERPDGALFIQDGLVKMDFTVQPSFPADLINTSQGTRHYVSDRTVAQNDGYIGLYTFQKTARYIEFEVALSSSTVSYAAVFKVIESGSNTQLGTIQSTEVLGNETVKKLRIDLGTPTFAEYAVRCLLLHNYAGATAYCRIIRVRHTDF